MSEWEETRCNQRMECSGHHDQDFEDADWKIIDLNRLPGVGLADLLMARENNPMSLLTYEW